MLNEDGTPKIRFVEYALTCIQIEDINNYQQYHWLNGYSSIGNDNFTVYFNRHWFKKHTVKLTRWNGLTGYSIPLTEEDKELLWSQEFRIKEISEKRLKEFDRVRAEKLERMSWWP